MIANFIRYQKENLHSTMFLLKHSRKRTQEHHVFLFTFHNVSIKTEDDHQELEPDANLHSTMFLLKPGY